jgi:hypothetical protein
LSTTNKISSREDNNFFTMSETTKERQDREDREDREDAARTIRITRLREENARLKSVKKAEDKLLAEVRIQQDRLLHFNHNGTPPAA